MKMPPPLMGFGKHRGKQVCDIPPDYAAWVRKSVDLPEDLAAEFERVWGGEFRRKGGYSRQHRHRWSPPPPPEPTGEIITSPLLRAMRRKWSAKLHPDRGGSREAMSLANQIFDDIEAEVAR